MHNFGVLNTEAILGGKSHIFAVTDGPLSGLPLSLLVSQRPRGADTDPAAMRETAWLVRRFATTTLPTVASLSTIRAERSEAAVRRNPFAGIGAPVLGVEIAAEEAVPPPGSDFFRGMLGDSNRIGASQVDQSPEAVLRVFRAQGLHATPRYSRRSYWPIWPKTQWIPDSGGFPKKESSRWRRAALRPPA